MRRGQLANHYTMSTYPQNELTYTNISFSFILKFTCCSSVSGFHILLICMTSFPADHSMCSVMIALTLLSSSALTPQFCITRGLAAQNIESTNRIQITQEKACIHFKLTFFGGKKHETANTLRTPPMLADCLGEKQVWILLKLKIKYHKLECRPSNLVLLTKNTHRLTSWRQYPIQDVRGSVKIFYHLKVFPRQVLCFDSITSEIWW